MLAAFSQPPIFVLGMTRRTGTTFLRDLLCLHPDCVPCPVREDYLGAYSDLLVNYADRVSEHWDARWGIDRDVEKDLLCRYIGYGLTEFLKLPRAALAAGQIPSALERPGARIVAKTPSIRSLEFLAKVFPQGQVLIMIRDGRAVVESAVRTFKRRYDRAAWQWADATQTLLRFQQSSPCNRLPYLAVKYEDLWMRREHELPRILSFLGLDIARYDFDAASKLPIRGSSELADAVHWAPVEMTAAFDPLHRWAQWDRSKHERFNWIAGDCLKCLGYQMKTYAGNRWFWVLWNEALDGRELATQLARRLLRNTGRLLVLLLRRFGRWSSCGVFFFFAAGMAGFLVQLIGSPCPSLELN